MKGSCYDSIPILGNPADIVKNDVIIA